MTRIDKDDRGRRHHDDFAGLPDAEANELAEVAEALRTDRFEADDPTLYDALHQRIMNEVAVTAIPGRDETSDAPAVGLVERLLGRLKGVWQGGMLSFALAAAAALLLTLLVLSKDQPEEPAPPLPDSPRMADRAPLEPGLEVQPLDGVEIPDELWHTGFLEHASIVDLDDADDDASGSSADQGAWTDAEDGDVYDDSDWDDDNSWAAADWSGDELMLDPLVADYDWGLGALDADDLAALDELLDG